MLIMGLVLVQNFQMYDYNYDYGYDYVYDYDYDYVQVDLQIYVGYFKDDQVKDCLLLDYQGDW